MKINDNLLDDEMQLEYQNALKKSRFLFFLFYLGLSLIVLSINFFFDKRMLLWTMLLIQLIFDLLKINNFKYVYYHESENNALNLYILNLRGNRARVSLKEEETKELEVSKNGKTITIPKVDHKQLKIVGRISQNELSKIIIQIKNKTV
jgi:hypothetical protein